MDKEQGNKLIAEFMGVEPAPEGEVNIYMDGEEMKEFGQEYHSSWDWLMPVVKKIQQLKIEDFPKKKPVMSALMDVETESLWQAVIVFIQWYNKNN